MPVTSVANRRTIFEEMNFGMVTEFHLHLYILGHGRDYTDWIPSHVSQDRDMFILGNPYSIAMSLIDKMLRIIVYN